MNYKIIKYVNVLLLLSGFFALSIAEGRGNEGKSYRDVTGTPSVYKFNVNNISTFCYADGRFDVDGGSSGFEFPKGSNKFAVYESGFTFAGIVNGEVRMNGSTFPSGMVAGRIYPDGSVQSEDDSRMYRVRPDWATGSMLSELQDGEKDGDEAAIRAQYQTDWLEWPWQDGAPYLDANGNGVYDPDPDGNGTYDVGEDVPGVPGAHQTIWFVTNATNSARSTSFYGSPPMDVEMQVSVWGYASVGPLGNMIFKKYKLINKGLDDIANTYVGVWCDPDVGNAGDDFVGCDTLLSAGFAYNAFAYDNNYEETPPCSGHDFFQGPIIPGEATDTALVNGMKIPGFKNRGMDAFFFFVNEHDTPYSDPDLDDYATGTLYFYNLMQGRIGATGQFFPIPESIGGGVTNYPLAGDPVTGEGYIDGILKEAADRRYGMTSGPFTLAHGDTQEVVVAQIVGGGTSGVNNLQAVSLFKTYDAVAQDAYNSNFELPSAPPAPQVKGIAMDQKVILTWDWNGDAIAATEGHDVKGYSFQGYNVYQLPTKSSQFVDAVKIATFDIVDGVKVIVDNAVDPATGATIGKVVQVGTDSGIERSIVIERDWVKNVNLYNGTHYYFAVTAYAYSPDEFAIPNNLENTLSAIDIIPQENDPGVRYGAEYGEVIEVSHATGISDGIVTATVTDPSATTGHDYAVQFALNDADVMVWSVVDVTTGETKVSGRTDQVGDGVAVDGIYVTVSGPAAGFKAGHEAEEIAYAGTVLDAPDKVWHSLNSNATYYISAGGGNGTIDRWERYADYLNAKDFEMRFTDGPNFGINAFEDDMIYDVPFELWAIGSGTYDDTSDDWRMIPFIYPNNAGTDGAFEYSGDVDPYFGFVASDWVYWMDPEETDGEVSYNKFKAACEGSGGPGSTYDWATYDPDWFYFADFHGGFVYPIGRFIICDYDLASSAGIIPSGTTVRLLTNKPITVSDSYSFSTPEVSYDAATAKQDVDQIQVFPNPYYGANPQELNKYQRYVTFNHLPPDCTIRIFNLGGQMVKKIEKSSNQQFERWDLLNQQGLPVGSGLYIAHIDMPDLGTTKILKLAIIQEQQILDRF